jgi:hypothetical protein
MGLAELWMAVAKWGMGVAELGIVVAKKRMGLAELGWLWPNRGLVWLS